MAKDTDYSTIERPYGSNLMRGGVGDIPVSEQPAVNNGSVEETVVKSEGGVSDVWVRNYVRSINWKPRISGFNIDGHTGDAQFSNIFLNQFSMITRVGLSSTNRVLSIMASAATIPTGKNYLFIGKDGREDTGDPLYTNLINLSVTENPLIADRDATNGVISLTATRGGTYDATPSLVIGPTRNIGSLVFTGAEIAAGSDLNTNGVSVALLSVGTDNRIRLGFYLYANGLLGNQGSSVGAIRIENKSNNNGLITLGAPLRLVNDDGATAGTYIGNGVSGAIQNGTLYYNTDSNQIRAYIAGAWHSLNYT